MNLEKLQNQLKAMTNSAKMWQDLAKYLKENPEIILFYQRQQLFVKSIDAEGNPLGYYSQNSNHAKPNKRPGMPFTMVETGLFRRGLYLKVYYRNFEISSDTPFLNEMLSNPFFNSVNFFGLTEDSMRRLRNTYLIPWIRNWYQKQKQLA